MTATTEQITRIEGYLVGLGMLDENRAGAGQADAEFLRALDMGSRVLAGMLEMPDVTGYSEDFGAALLQKLEGMDADELRSTRQAISNNADIDLRPDQGLNLNPFQADKTAAKWTLQSRLEDAGVPRSQWSKIKVGGLLPLIDQADDIVGVLNDITGDEQVAAAQTTLRQETQSAVQTATASVVRVVAGSGDSVTQEQISEYVGKLQTDFEYPHRQRDSIFSSEFSQFLREKISASGAALPEGYDAQTLTEFADAMDVLRTNGVYKPPRVMTPAMASGYVESILKDFAPELNTQLEKASADAAEKMGQAPDGFMGELVGMFAQFMGADLLDIRIPEIETVDGVFDWRSQASLQGLMMVLGHPKVLNFNSDAQLAQQDMWHYTPEKGRFILRNLDGDEKDPGLRQLLEGMMLPEDFAKIEPLLTDKNMGQLIEALNVLYDDGQITPLNLFEDKYEAPGYMESLFQDMADKYGKPIPGGGSTEPRNLDMLRLLDTMTREFAGPDIAMQRLMRIEMPDLGIDVPKDPEGQRAQLAQFYTAARRRSMENGALDPDSDFNADVMVILNTVVTLPFGDGDYRRGFNAAAERAIREAAEIQDPDEAGREFARILTEANEALVNEHGNPEYRRYYERELPVWKPGLANMDPIVSGGEQFTVQQIAQSYDDYHLFKAGEAFQKQGQSMPISYHQTVIFRDDSGQVWSMAIERQSMVFSIERLDVDGLVHIVQQMDKLQPEELGGSSLSEHEREAILQDLGNRIGDTEFMGRLRETVDGGKGISAATFRQALRATGDPGWALYDQAKGTGANVADFLGFAMSDDVPSLRDFAHGYGSSAQEIREENEVREREQNNRPNTLISEHIAGDLDQGELSYSEVVANQQGGAVSVPMQDQNTLITLATQYMYARPLIIEPDRSSHQGAVELLREYAGQRFRAHAGPHGGPEVNGIQMPKDYDGPMIAWYDKTTQDIKAIPVPAELWSEEGRNALKGLTSVMNPPSLTEFHEALQSRPQIYEMVRDMQEAMGRTVLQRTPDQPLDATSRREYQLALHNILLHVEADLENTPDLSAFRQESDGSLGRKFGGHASGTTRLRDAVGSRNVSLRQAWDEDTAPPPTTSEIRAETAAELTGVRAGDGVSVTPNADVDPDRSINPDNVLD